MASQVLSGSSNPSYTNNTGQNVRVVINYMRSAFADDNLSNRIVINWAGVSAQANISLISTVFGPIAGSPFAIGRNLAIFYPFGYGNNLGGADGEASRGYSALPTELMLAPGQTFSAVCTVYNIVVIPEAG